MDWCVDTKNNSITFRAIEFERPTSSINECIKQVNTMLSDAFVRCTKMSLQWSDYTTYTIMVKIKQKYLMMFILKYGYNGIL